MKKIFHIPHSSKFIPEEYINDYIVSPEYLKLSIDIICDNDLDRIVSSFNPCSIVFPYSRLFCDTEIMNSIGMGVLYTHNHELV